MSFYWIMILLTATLNPCNADWMAKSLEYLTEIGCTRVRFTSWIKPRTSKRLVFTDALIGVSQYMQLILFVKDLIVYSTCIKNMVSQAWLPKTSLHVCNAVTSLA